MFGSIGGAELVLVLVLALLLFGPRKLPQIGRMVGDALAQFRKATHDFKNTLENEVELEEVRAARRELSAAASEIRDPGVPRGSTRDDDGVTGGVGPARSDGTSGSTTDGPTAPVSDAGGRREN